MGIFDPISNMFGGGAKISNPADAANPFLNQIPGQMKPYYQPYIDQGKNALNILSPEFLSLIQNPGEKTNQIGSSFQSSPGFEFQMKNAMNAANSAAQAGGMAGTPYHQQNAATLANNLANQDYYNYMDRATGLYGQGLQGMSGINQMGFNASNELAQSLAHALMTQASLAYKGQDNMNAQAASGANNLLQVGGALLSAFSDIRLKTDIENIGHKNGHNIYRFRYIHAPEKIWSGVIAQEVLSKNPEAVSLYDGYLKVDYSKLGLEMREL